MQSLFPSHLSQPFSHSSPSSQSKIIISKTERNGFSLTLPTQSIQSTPKSYTIPKFSKISSRWSPHSKLKNLVILKTTSHIQMTLSTSSSSTTDTNYCSRNSITLRNSCLSRMFILMMMMMIVSVSSERNLRVSHKTKSLPLVGLSATPPAAYSSHQALSNLNQPSHVIQHPLVQNAINSALIHGGSAVSGLAGHPIYGGPTITPPVQQRSIAAAINGGTMPLTTLGNVPLVTNGHHNIISPATNAVPLVTNSLHSSPTVLTSSSSDPTSPKTTTTIITTTTS